ncbi:hypothetical protein HPB49_007675 [Dermacentor silvarum]|uniref:Uncharacterized protein n=1 Tax=Dermacentor silvarum TaxID=543639 RepID=A0ACB8C824_DERSI|nr:hypothetical protein HPB49_007675 [Dermacentor silvarum]
MADLVSGPLECCAVRVRLEGTDTTVASVYIRPGQPWDPACLRQLAHRLEREFLLCGDVNSHHTAWGSRRCCPRGKELQDVLQQLGLQILNTGLPTFLRRSGRAVRSAIHISVATEGYRYSWAPLPDTWGSDHLPLLLSPFQGKTPRSREYHIVDWRAFRRLCHQDTSGGDLLQLVVDSARAATVTTTAQIQELCSESIRIHELEAALSRTKRRSTPGADGITFQMLRNLEEAGRQRLLEFFNDIWSTEDIPESWRGAVVAPILKPRKPATALCSYRPVSLTSAACKVLERVALARLEWIAAQLQFFPEQQSGFRCYRCTADSIADVVATLEDAKACGDVAMLVLLDVESAFDGLPHTVVEAAMDGLGIIGCLRGFVTAFLSGRTFRVRLGRELSEPRDITADVPQGSVLSPFLFNMALAGLPASLPAAARFPARCSIYADDVALWVRGLRRSIPAIRRSLQEALDAVVSYLGGIGLRVLPRGAAGGSERPPKLWEEEVNGCTSAAARDELAVFEPGGQQFGAPGANEARGPAWRDVRGKVQRIAEPGVDEGVRGNRAPAASARGAG